MFDNSRIKWIDTIWDPITGCPPALVFREDILDQPLKWNKPGKILVCSMGDLFHEDVPDQWLEAVFSVMHSIECRRHTFMLLTKRPERMKRIVERLEAETDTFNRAFPNVWLGVTIENQRTADDRIPILLDIRAAVRFVYCEPLFEEIDIFEWLNPRQYPAKDGYGGDHAPGWITNFRTIDWVMCGNEPSHDTGQVHPDRVSSLIGQCQKAGVPFHFKQCEAWSPVGQKG
ncbi:DUF5131 family protein [Acetomicrobium sp. S15 = DSM 107314]|uniref:DUF5131 family protein n=1 Tax=Acetomicrobium sp. S15 = DSM 107314 TaxID=2529858 RepID=UPI0018E1BAE7|nr:DUF5131 family protein [Acetomicrobium sp. S15 = DSM 107314]